MSNQLASFVAHNLRAEFANLGQVTWPWPVSKVVVTEEQQSVVVTFDFVPDVQLGRIRPEQKAKTVCIFHRNTFERWLRLPKKNGAHIWRLFICEIMERQLMIIQREAKLAGLMNLPYTIAQLRQSEETLAKALMQ